MARIRRGLERGVHAPPAPPVPEVADGTVRRCRPEEDLVARFCAGARAVGMEVQRVAAGGLVEGLAGHLRRQGVGTVVLAATDRGPLEEAVARAGARCVPDADEDALYAADAGLTDVAAAVAEDGSLVHASGSHHPRAAVLVPPRHVAVVRAEQIVPDLVDLYACGVGTAAAATTVITGPSKTADIEGVLVTGVHGPGAVDVWVVD